jgi:hypothetical protein
MCSRGVSDVNLSFEEKVIRTRRQSSFTPSSPATNILRIARNEAIRTLSLADDHSSRRTWIELALSPVRLADWPHYPVPTHLEISPKMLPRTHHPWQHLAALVDGGEEQTTGILGRADRGRRARQGLHEVQEGREVGENKAVERWVRLLRLEKLPAVLSGYSFDNGRRTCALTVYQWEASCTASDGRRRRA